ncbi:MAG: hypothetical protein NC421_07435 [Lachnospiraceae bacterium]|nr:hypothetical protein [Lachnospiraceae bacterium]
MKARVKATGKIVEVEKTVCYCATWSDHERIYNKSDLDFNLDPPHPEATISGWIVRDKQSITSILAHRGSKLYLCQEKPERIDSMGIWDKDSDYYRIPDNFFPNITFESDPLEVEIQIKPKKQ